MENKSIRSTAINFLNSDYCEALAPSTRDLYGNALMKNFVPFCSNYPETELNAEFVLNELPAYAEYLEKLEVLHHLLVYAMKSKQTTDLAHVEKLRILLSDFHMLYFDHEAGSHK